MKQFRGELVIGGQTGSIAKGDKGFRSRAAYAGGKRGTVLIDGDADTGPDQRTRLFHPGSAGGVALGIPERERASIGDNRTDDGYFIVIVQDDAAGEEITEIDFIARKQHDEAPGRDKKQGRSQT